MSKKKQHVCGSCGKRCATQGALSTHRRCCPVRMKCAKCNKVCKSINALNAHLRHCNPIQSHAPRKDRRVTKRERDALNRDKSITLTPELKRRRHKMPSKSIEQGPQFKGGWTKDLIEHLFHGTYQHGLNNWDKIIDDKSYGFLESKVPMHALWPAYEKIVSHLARNHSPRRPPTYEYVDCSFGTPVPENEAVVTPSPQPKLSSEEQWKQVLEDPNIDARVRARSKGNEGGNARSWSPSEEADLIAGIRKHSFGQWTKIKQDSNLKVGDRTPTQLKDKARNLLGWAKADVSRWAVDENLLKSMWPHPSM